MELQLKHILPYFEHDLRGVIKQKIVTVSSLHKNSLETKPSVHRFTYCSFHHFTPILRPLSDLTKKIEVNGEKFVPSERHYLEVDKNGFCYERYYADQCESPFVDIPVQVYNEWLYEYHFDVFDLISKGIAIDINTLNK